MASDAEMLLKRPAPWEHGGKTYLLARPDFEVELLLQAEHEAWARNRIEAVRSRVSPETYEADVAGFGEARDGNLFAFGGKRFFAWVNTDAGMVEYLHLLLAKGGTAVKRDWLRDLARGDRAAWLSLVNTVVARDFPPRAPEAGGGSGAQATPPPSTSDASSSSPTSPGS